MARLNVVEAAWNIHGKSGGMCFSTSRIGTSVRINPHIRNWRSVRQKPRIDNMLYCTRAWGSLVDAQRANWAEWVTAFPQPTVNDPLVALRAYENFVKRQFYLNLTTGYPYQPMVAPVGVEYAADPVTVVVKTAIGSVTLDCTFANGSGELDTLIFLSRSRSAGKQFVDTSWRYMATVRSTNQTIDITDMYFSEFGQLPGVGDNLFLAVVQCGNDNGQFWFPVLDAVVVQPAAPPIFYPKFGMLYTWYVANSALIGNNGFIAPTRAIADSVIAALGGATVAGGYLKDTSSLYWNAPNTGASNLINFSARGGGGRVSASGNFTAFKQSFFSWCSNQANDSSGRVFHSTFYNSATASGLYDTKWSGKNIRLCKYQPGLTDGQFSTYTGNDGKVYEIMSFNSYWWLTGSLCETLLSNGTPIANITASSEWAANRTLARCSINNDANND